MVCMIATAMSILRSIPPHSVIAPLAPSLIYMTATTSSILRIIPTHSVASLSALELTRTGWITCSAYMSLMVPLRTLIPGTEKKTKNKQKACTSHGQQAKACGGVPRCTTDLILLHRTSSPWSTTEARTLLRQRSTLRGRSSRVSSSGAPLPQQCSRLGPASTQ